MSVWLLRNIIGLPSIVTIILTIEGMALLSLYAHLGAELPRHVHATNP